MRLPRDLLLYGSPRGGTSLVAAIFVAHGVPVSGGYLRTDGYPSFEDLAVKTWLKDYAKPIWTGEYVPAVKAPQLAEFLDTVPRPLFFKCAIEYAELFTAALPAHDVVSIYRDIGQTVKSICKRKGGDPAAVRRVVEWRHAALAERPGAHRVDAERIARGDFRQLAAAFEAIGLAWNRRIAEGAVIPERLTQPG